LKYEPFDVRLTLGRVSLFERISPDVCDAVLGEGRHAEKLRSLARRNVFVTRTYESGEEEEYRLHPLFRGFLRRWLESELGSEKVRELHRLCADYFAGASGLDMSLYHYAEAQAPDAIADLLASRGAELVELGRFEIIKHAFELIPQDLFAGREQALIARADVAMIEGARQLALTLYRRAFDLVASSGDIRVSAESLRGEAYIARYQGEFDQAIAL